MDEMFRPGAHAQISLARIIRDENDLYFCGHIDK
jgi:hypothetical protein